MRLGFYCNLFVFVVFQAVGSVSTRTSQDVLGDNSVHQGTISFLSDWKVLGPFRLGTREAIWGADPVERYGGIRCISYSQDAWYHSSLTRNASVKWSNRTFSSLASESGTSVDLTVDFPDVDWEFAQKIYGWSAFQFQGWLKGGLLNSNADSQTVILYPDNIVELWINDVHVFGGDFYGFARAPLVLDLQPGLNTVSVRLTRDVRSMGGSFPPISHALLRAEVIHIPVEVVHDSVLLPDVIDGRFCSRHGSITVRNQADTWTTIHGITAKFDASWSVVTEQEIQLAPGQSRPIKMVFDADDKLGKDIEFALKYTLSDSKLLEVVFKAELRHTNVTSLQKFTFLHPSGAVSYAVLRPPPVPASIAPNQQLQVPILLHLHGAGVEADGGLARHTFDDAPNLPAWILSPTGMSSWSGDDWHTWGFADAQAAASAIPDWIKRTNWPGPGVSSGKILVAGHSNGGQGTWFFASHQPDRVLGAAAASGYSSIENYVPYVLWNEADSLQSGILQISRNNFRHELLTENLVGLPIFQQHGSRDDNVPTYHSRLMNTLLARVGESAQYSELPNTGHWFDGSMTTEGMVEFYLDCLNSSDSLPRAPEDFAFVAPNSNDLGSRYGILIDQLGSPDRMGKVKVTVSIQESHIRWHLRTENIHRLHLDPSARFSNSPDEILLDDMAHGFDVALETKPTTFVLSHSNIWGREVALDWKTLEQRHGRQRGVLDSILRTASAFEIVYCSDETLTVAVQASRNFLQYFGADSNVVPSSKYQDALGRRGNVITISLGKPVPTAQLPTFPIQLEDERLLLTTKELRTISIPFSPGMGGIWLRPLSNERLELVVWGRDEVGLRQAARLIPTLTGAGQPDFVILSDEARWKGHAGALAMGFFDFHWRISSASYLP
ncbi:uncharacterized protein Z518_00185 [Rhinocladiella mackenziei CBS 650.93]|uniref:Rhinocladiella mackenziei CBS 650.93 unplaced genomic scaffold supercont1.1, whole genome shotgun sequence n=1 Tax=Rhinocladiella mackenziei CBS 650.93 TaxID=1442369 RepID=A0A0D2G3G4_9EURO|nr:uncharacterized protein Z518_00185 [Rhinocladiella mackenziei CBS 650.93]KIX09107.1 hypothetical protein Z518_00185 [Rhinocladiella mackenziei CBS 650.93]